MVSHALVFLVIVILGMVSVSSGVVPKKSNGIFHINKQKMRIRPRKFSICIISGCFRAKERKDELSQRMQLQKAILKDYRKNVLVGSFRLLGK